MRSRSHRGALVLASAGTVIAGVLLLAAPAFAERTYDSQVSGVTQPHGVTIDSSDHLWVSDPGNEGKIFKYNAYPSQTLESTQTGGGHYGAYYIWSIAVNSTNGYLYVADSGPEVVDVFDPSAFVEQWHLGGGYDFVAVDNSPEPSKGTVYVVSPSGPGVRAFSPGHSEAAFSASEPYVSGNTITGTPSGPFARPWNVSVDNEGNIYVVDQNKKVIDEFKSDGEFVREFTEAGVPGGFSGDLSGVAVDPTNGNVLVVDSGTKVVDEFESTGEYLDQITGTSPTAPFGSLEGGIAVDSEGYVYVADGEKGAVDIFTPNVPLPKITYQPVSNLTQTSVTLNGTVNPNEGGDVTACKFDYGPTTSYGSSVPCTPATPYASTTPVSASLTGLTPDVTYHYRIVASNEHVHGTKNGPDQTITTHAVAGVCTEPATSVTRTSASVHGCFTGNGEQTEYYFEWGATEAYGNKTSIENAGSVTGGSHVTETFTLIGLTAEHTYHYRFVATNAVGSTRGLDQSFETPLAVQHLETEAATNLTGVSAILHGSWKGNGEDTHYYFQWGFAQSYGQTTEVPPGLDGGSGIEPQVMQSAEIANLNPNTVYHYRIVATNATGTSYGADRALTTLPFPVVSALPTIEYTMPTANSPTASVTVQAHLDPDQGGNITACHFEYGNEAGSYELGRLPCMAGSPPNETEVGTSAFPITSPIDLHARLEDLAPGATYHFRLVATSPAGTVNESDQSFAAVPLPPTIDASSSVNVTQEAATLNADIRPGFGATVYHFEYGPTPAYGSRTPSSSAIGSGSDDSDHSLSVEIAGLAPGTTYHFRVVAVNFGGVVAGPDQMFTTTNYPSIISTSVSAVSSTAATLGALINPSLSSTTYYFEYGIESSYGSRTPERTLIGSDSEAQLAGATVTGLAPATTYHFRVVAVNGVGTTFGLDQQLTTVPAEEAKPAKPAKCKAVYVRRHGKCVKRHRHTKRSGKSRKHE